MDTTNRPEWAIDEIDGIAPPNDAEQWRAAGFHWTDIGDNGDAWRRDRPDGQTAIIVTGYDFPCGGESTRSRPYGENGDGACVETFGTNKHPTMIEFDPDADPYIVIEIDGGKCEIYKTPIDALDAINRGEFN